MSSRKDNSPMPPLLILKQTRATGRKVRTGCLTCKSRHIKCDETKPECIRCATTGRHCEGYIDWINTSSLEGNSSSHDSPVATPPPMELPLVRIGSSKEVRSVELFFLKVAPQLAGHFQESYWKFVLQVSMSEVSIRYALVAISAVYEQECIEPHQSPETLQKLGLDYYNRAIRSMVKKLDKKESVIVLAIGCLLFTCLEFLRRDIQAAITHIDGGIQMIERARAMDLNSAIRPQPYEMELIETLIAPVFSYLNVTALAFGRPGVYFYSRSGEPEDLPPMRTLDEALASLLDITNTSMKFFHDVGKRKYVTGNLEPADYEHRNRLSILLATWHEYFKELEKDKGQFWTGYGRTTLQIMHRIVNLWLLTCCSVNETSWDAYRSEFEELLVLTEQVISKETSSYDKDFQARLISFELSYTLPLELITRKCRYPVIRRKALALLHRAHKSECFLDSMYCAVLNDRIMELEEASMKASSKPIGDDHLPPEEDRIHLVYFAFEEIQGLTKWPVMFLSKPDGIEGEWCVRKESLDPTKFLHPRWTINYSPLNENGIFLRQASRTSPSRISDKSMEDQPDIAMLTPLGWPVVDGSMSNPEGSSVPIMLRG